MFKLFTKKQTEEIIVDKEVEEGLQTARYRFLGAMVLFFGVMLFAPIVIKKPSERPQNLQIQLINDSDIIKNKNFKKIKNTEQVNKVQI